MRSPTLAICTPWRDHHELCADYFDAVKELGDRDELVIVDDASSLPLSFAKIRLEESRGFCGASNEGLRNATTDAVLFLNNDIAPMREGWLEDIRTKIEPGVLVGHMRFDAHANVDGQSFPYIDGWCLAGMRDDILSLGGFDETLEEPAYYSDNLLCLEARAAGMTLREVRVGLRHKENVTAGPGRDPHVQAVTASNRARYVARARELLT